MENKDTKSFYATFFIKYGILTAFIAGFFLITVYPSVLARSFWVKNMKFSVEKMLDEKYQGEWSLENPVPINNAFSVNAVCFDGRNRKNGELYKIVAVRMVTFYGPFPGVFIISDENNVTFAGYADIHGRISRQLDSSFHNVRIEYWKNHILEVLEDKRK